MKLYFSPAACSMAPHIVAAEAGIELELVKVDTQRHVTASGADYDAINSKGQVPFLVLEDGSTLSEGPVIAQYLADHARALQLMPPPGSVGRYRVMEWQNYVTSELHKSYTPLFNPKFDAAAKAIQMAQLRQKYEWLEKQLAGKNFLTGADFTAADAYLFTVTGWAKYVQLDLSDLPNLQAYLGRVAARPAVVKAMTEEGLLKS